MPTPFDSTYWQEEADELYEELLPLFLAALELGFIGGTDAMPLNVQALVNPNSFNQAAIDYAREYRYSLIKDITDTTRTQTQQIMTDWLQSGQSLDVLEEQLARIFGESRAAAIAATETTRVVSEGNLMAFRSTGFIEKVRFNTVVDDRVCPYCSPLNGKEIAADDYGYLPPIHVRCRCFVTPIVSEEAVAAQLDEILGL